ncbi:MAG: GntR family transcriptional regulator [Gammaproteobacteria bacterium]
MPEIPRNETVIPLPDSGTLSDRVCNQLKEEIITGRLEQGAKIKEEVLAREHGISRGPLREAIRRLEGMHLVQRVPHAGARVVTLTHKMMSDIYRVREALEGMSARLAAENMHSQDIDALRKLLEQHEHAIEETDGKVYFQREGDVDFHFRIAQASGNDWLIHHLSSELYQLIRMCRYRSALAPSRPVKALAEHRQIVEAIAAGDGELAELLMRRHISGAWQIVKDLLPRETHD